MSDIQDNIEYIIKIHEILTTIPHVHIYISRINNRLVLKIKDGYKLELQMPKTIKLFCSTKKLTNKTKNGENVLSLEVVEVVLVHRNLVNNQYQQKSEVLYLFTSNKFYVYFLNVKPNHCLLANSNGKLFKLSNATIFYKTQNKKTFKGNGFLSFVIKYKKQLLDT